MDISQYTSFFHDGEVISIEYKEKDIVFFIQSAEIYPPDVKDTVLSKHNRLRGKLHVEAVRLILENDIKFDGVIKMKLSDNDLLHLEIKQNILFVEIGWRGFQPFQNDFSALEIYAEKIWWENISDLET